MQFLLGMLFLVIAVSCTDTKDVKKVADNSRLHDTVYHKLNAFGCIRGDTSKFVELKCGLYINSDGIIAFPAIDNSYRMDTSADSKPLFIYLTTIYGADPYDSINGGQKEIRFVVDTSTFKILGTFYFKDKNHIYDFNPMVDGGTIGINTDIDKNSFQILESECYGKDNKHCFYRGRLIEGADLRTFKVLDTSYSFHIAYDKNDFYDCEYKMSKTAVIEQRLDSIRQRKNSL
jgi:hypothetical protein